MKDQLTGMVRAFPYMGDINVSILRTLYKETAIGVCHMTDIFHVDKMPVHSVVYKKYEAWNRIDKYLPTLVASSIFNFVQIIYLSVIVVIFVILFIFFLSCYFWYQYSVVTLPMANTCIFGRYPTVVLFPDAQKKIGEELLSNFC